MSAPYEVRAVEHVGGFRLRVSFADGSAGVVDLTEMLATAGPVFEPLRDEGFFSQAAVDSETGTVVWPNGADLAPEFLHSVANGSTPSTAPR